MKTGETKLVPSDRIMLGDPYHVCMVVRDVEKTAATYASLFGIGPFTIRQVSSDAGQATVHGQPAAYTLKFGYARTGTMMLELVETVTGHTIYEEFLAKHGEGMHHLGFRAPPPLDDELARWRAQGIEALQVNRRDDPRYGWAYLDTQSLTGCLIEIVCDPAIGWWESLALARDLEGPLGRGTVNRV